MSSQVALIDFLGILFTIAMRLDVHFTSLLVMLPVRLLFFDLYFIGDGI